MQKNKKSFCENMERYHKKYKIVYSYSDSGFMHDKLQSYIDIMIERAARM